MLSVQTETVTSLFVAYDNMLVDDGIHVWNILDSLKVKKSSNFNNVFSDKCFYLILRKLKSTKLYNFILKIDILMQEYRQTLIAYRVSFFFSDCARTDLAFIFLQMIKLNCKV